jgi:hypothetical protein
VVELKRPKKVAYETTTDAGGRLEMIETVDDSDGSSKVEFEIDYDLPDDLQQLMDSEYAERRNERELEHSLHLPPRVPLAAHLPDALASRSCTSHPMMPAGGARLVAFVPSAP